MSLSYMTQPETSGLINFAGQFSAHSFDCIAYNTPVHPNTTAYTLPHKTDSEYTPTLQHTCNMSTLHHCNISEVISIKCTSQKAKHRPCVYFSKITSIQHGDDRFSVGITDPCVSIFKKKNRFILLEFQWGYSERSIMHSAVSK